MRSDCGRRGVRVTNLCSSQIKKRADYLRKGQRLIMLQRKTEKKYTHTQVYVYTICLYMYVCTYICMYILIYFLSFCF